MPARTQISVEEYLTLSYNDRPEPDYVHGDIVERSLPTPTHAKVQGILAGMFFVLGKRAPLHSLPELRARVAPDVFHVIDLAIYVEDLPQGRYASEPAYVAIEVVSPDDRYTNMIELLEEHRRWCVPHIWLVDPWLKRLCVYSETGLATVDRLRLDEFDFEIRPEDLFRGI